VDIGIVGAGFAGLTAALCLARAGHRVTVYERAEDPGPVGAAIVLQPSGLAVLASLGLEDEVTARSARLDRLHVTNPRGKTLVDLHYATLEAGWYGLGIGRGVLFSALWGAVKAAGIAVRTGVVVVGVERTSEGLGVLGKGAEVGRHQLVVAADGARSRVADAVPGRRVSRYPWGALFRVGEFADTTTLHQVGSGARRFMGVLPMGQGRASLFWSLREDRLDAWRAGFVGWRDEALRLGPWAASLIEPLASPDELLFAPYFDVRMKRWHADRVVAIGDAAHATSPQLGQGSNLALWDAFVLGEVLSGVEASGLDLALATYSARRKKHLAYYQRATRWLTPFFQSDSRVLGWMRDVGMPIIGWFGPTKRLMTASMAGVAAGFFGQRESLPVVWTGSRRDVG
jgi:2-polyprenyl-6-methoxyphenol hydroxylase-like FAD-dependent oxidoreductase